MHCVFEIFNRFYLSLAHSLTHISVADCVCLMSLDKNGAVPVDTHVLQIARKYLKAGVKAADDKGDASLAGSTRGGKRKLRVKEENSAEK